MEMPTGTIKKLVADRGSGFFAAEAGKDFFFHRSGTEGDFDSLQGGEKVSFEIEASPKGPRAKSVRTLQGVNDQLSPRAPRGRGPSPPQRDKTPNKPRGPRAGGFYFPRLPSIRH